MAQFNYQDYIKSAGKQMAAIQAAPDLRSFLSTAYAPKIAKAQQGGWLKHNPLMGRLSDPNSAFTDREYDKLFRQLYPGQRPTPITGSGGMITNDRTTNFGQNWADTVSWHNKFQSPDVGLFGDLAARFGDNNDNLGEMNRMQRFNYFKGMTPEQSGNWMGTFSNQLGKYNADLSKGPGLFGRILSMAPGAALGFLGGPAFSLGSGLLNAGSRLRR